MSNSRLEKFIYAICSMEVSDLPAPLSRIEILWNCLITGETPDFEPQSRNEQYLMAMLGLYELENLPTPMSRGEKLLYKIAMGETDLSDIPAYLSRYEELLGYLAENGGVGDFEYILQTLNQRLSTLYSTKERPMKQAVIKGDTLVNELPRPSLKNTMTNVASQKLNHGYDNGKTLVNIHPVNYSISMATNTTFFADDEIVRDSVQPNTKYIIRLYNTHESITQIYFKPCVTQKLSVLSTNNKCAIFTTKETLSDSDLSNNKIHFYSNVAITLDDVKNTKILVCKYQDGMENWDIPYFEGTKTFSATPNVVDGEFKQAVVKGQTLVNIKGEETVETSNANTCHDFFIPLVKKNTDYLIKYDTTISGGVLAVGFLKDGSSWSNNRENQPNTGLFKLNSDKYPNYFRIIGQPAEIVTVNNLMIIEYQDGMENWDIPYFEGMQSVQLSEVTTTGKNLFDLSKASDGYFAGNSPYSLAQSNYKTKTSEYIKVEPNTNYIYSFDGFDISQINNEYWGAYYFYKGINEVSVIEPNRKTFASTTKKEFLITTPSDCHYIRIGSRGLSLDGATVQLEKGSTVTPYEPYQSNTLTLAEPVTLRKVGEVEDEFDALTGQVTERVGEVVSNSSDGWTPNNVVFNNVYEFKHPLPRSGVNFKAISNSFNQAPSGDFERFNTYGNVLYLCINKSKLSSNTLDSLDEYLKSNPLTVQYQLATSTTKQVTPTITNQDGVTQTKLHSFNDGHLSVTSQGLLPSAVDYEVPTNNSYYLPDMLTLGAQYTARGSADCNATIDGKLLALGKNRTFTTPSTLTSRLMVLDAPVDDLMFIKGDQTAKDFGYFEGMKSVVLSNKMPVLTTTGKNLFDKSDVTQGLVLDVNTGELKNGHSGFSTSGFINVLPNTTYIRQGDSCTEVVEYDYSKNFSKKLTWNNHKITTSNNASYIRFVYQDVKVDGLQLEKGSIATSYEPFKSNILSTPEDVTLRGIGEVKDELDCLTGEVTERIGEIVLDGSENWVWDTTILDLTVSAYVLNLIDTNPSDSTNVICDCFPSKKVNTIDEEGIYIHASKGFRLRVLKTKLSSQNIEGFKNYLQSNPITVQYQLATESIKTVDLTTVDQDGQPTKLKTFNDITHVEIKADNLIPSVDLEVATKINETLATLDPQQLNISNTQNQLGQTIDEQTENTDATMMATTEIYEQTL